MVDKITLYEGRLVMDIKHHGLKSLIRELKTGNDVTVSVSEDKDIISLTIPVLVKRWNGRKLIIVPGDEDFPEEAFEPSAMAKRLAQGYQWMSLIESGEYPTMARLAEELRLDPSIVDKSINMVNLSPKIQRMIVEADTPKAINRDLHDPGKLGGTGTGVVGIDLTCAGQSGGVDRHWRTMLYYYLSHGVRTWQNNIQHPRKGAMKTMSFVAK